MGFFSFLIEETADLFSGIAEDTRQLGDELIHISDSSYVSPYQKKADAREKINRADRKMANAKSAFQQHYNQVNNRIKENYEMKKKLLGKLDDSLSGAREVKIKYDMRTCDYFRNRDDFKFGEFLGFFGHDIMDQAANQYLEDARDYEIEARGVVARIEQQEEKLHEIELQIEREEAILCVVSRQYELESATRRRQIADSLKCLLECAICDSNGNISKRYVNELEKLSSL